MPPSTATATRRLFVASLVFFLFSLVFSVTNVVTVLSAPLRSAVTVPPRIGFQGYAADGSGNPLATGAYTVTVNVYDAATGGASKWQGIYANTPITDGLYSLTLNGPFTDTVFNGDRWLGVAINGGAEITPRSRVASVPFALNAEQAQHVDWSGLNGVPAGFVDGVDDVGTGAPGSGAAGRVSVFTSATNVDGAANLLFANNILTVTGNIRTTGSIQQSTALGARVYHTANQSVPHNTNYLLQFGSERFDTDNVHYTSAANLSGTVAKTNGSTTLTGTGTAFTTELAVGQLISVPGGATEVRVVTAIASNTSLTVNAAFANTASGQTAARKNTALVARTAGTYLIVAQWEWASNSAGNRFGGIVLNGVTTLAGSSNEPNDTGNVERVNLSTIYELAQWDYVEVNLFQTSGSALNIQATANLSPEFMLVRLP